ncbi:class I SAM-dependent methyltransferase [Verrucosispora sp. WMMC514]|uniref:class I SAM-dependent methyltransferase n=1 Tax=Verrucosispora sp. WMMC514 TaxID=3015156 RepID=UPI00248ACB0D|nr:class I SAM-dependent methyltransferase [Verrucosispora sp. WMMC514]WBB92324.1 class I SAM-dependent methyltransferase [Verrucosispora sp. WMMC514]
MSLDLHPAQCLNCGHGQPHRQVLGGAVRRCTCCGLGWTVPDPTVGPARYDVDYFTGGGYEDYFRNAPRRFEAGRRLRWLSTVVPPSVLVEAGCAGGYFLEAAQRAGFTVTGVEVSQVAAKFAVEQLRVPVRQGYFEQVAATLQADVVCAFHVLEHVDDPRTFLRTAREVLPPGGWLALEVPNIASAAATRLGHQWPALQLAYHRWHFTPTALTRLLATEGFEVVRQDTAAFRFYMPIGFRIRHARRLLPSDWIDLRSPALTHRWRGDLLRVIARRPRDVRSG